MYYVRFKKKKISEKKSYNKIPKYIDIFILTCFFKKKKNTWVIPIKRVVKSALKLGNFT